MRESPFPALDLKLFRDSDLQQMAHRRRHDVLFALLVIIHLLESAQRLGDVARHRRFLCDYQCFSHDKILLPYTTAGPEKQTAALQAGRNWLKSAPLSTTRIFRPS